MTHEVKNVFATLGEMSLVFLNSQPVQMLFILLLIVEFPLHTGRCV